MKEELELCDCGLSGKGHCYMPYCDDQGGRTTKDISLDYMSYGSIIPQGSLVF